MEENEKEIQDGQREERQQKGQLEEKQEEALREEQQEEKQQEAEQKGKRKEKSPKEEEPFSLKREIISWVQVLVTALVLAFLCNTFLIANSQVPTGSMETTIMAKDRVIGSRLSYRFGDPKRGDIVIFKFGWICNHCKKAMGEGEAPETCPLCGKEIDHPKTLYYVKRVIGMPGDVVEIKQEGSVNVSELSEVPAGIDSSPENADAELVTAAVYINGEKLDESYIREPMLYTGDMKFEVPEDSYFLMGDNRNSSMDARYWKNPYISREKLIAKVLLRYFPTPALLH